MNEGIKVLYYHFTPEEVKILYTYFQHEYIDRNREDVWSVVNHISKIVESSNGLPRRNNQAT